MILIFRVVIYKIPFILAGLVFGQNGDFFPFKEVFRKILNPGKVSDVRNWRKKGKKVNDEIRSLR